MLTKSSMVMMLLIATITTTASLIGISSIYQALPAATAQSQSQQQTQITKYLQGKLLSF